MGGQTEGDQWSLLCLHCGELIESTELIVKEQIRLQQEAGGHGCHFCKAQCPATGKVENGRLFFTCTNCGFKEVMTLASFDAYMKRVGGRLNP